MYEQFVNILVDELQIDKDEITMESELSNDLGINSIELADLVMICEDRFGIDIDDDEIRGFTTVGDVVTYLENKN
ncbi:MAG: acyl carrier protein [Ruminococcaceae bacterium]|nr:acyl carrier protein [Oscillospiraceae bacterium]